ncbi:MAG TPA: hypothetical protein VFJ96_11375, partial [Gemmatimonadaceae bacterium]|nr:hypothetical protein [Gemmatimonadaceae bacterium]
EALDLPLAAELALARGVILGERGVGRAIAGGLQRVDDRRGEQLAPAILDALHARSDREADTALAAYDARRRAEFGGKWKVERLVALAVASPWLMNRAARTLARRKDMADLLVGVAGDFVPPAEVLRVGYVLSLLINLGSGYHSRQSSVVGRQ